MNYLAHLLLAEPTEDSRLGAMIGDFMTGLGIDEFAPGVREGILLHRRIDEITDAQPIFRRSRARLPGHMQRFTGIIVDVVYDHFLAATWDRWHSTDLAAFAQEIYALLRRRADELPPRLQRALPWIIDEDWLGSYRDAAHLERAFTGMARRVKRSNPLGEAFVAFRDNYDGLAEDFDEFFPKLRSSVS